MENPIDKLKYERAKERLTELKAFYIMLIGSCLLIPFLIFLNHHFIPEFQWFWVPVIGGGVSVFGYALFYFIIGKGIEFTGTTTGQHAIDTGIHKAVVKGMHIIVTYTFVRIHRC